VESLLQEAACRGIESHLVRQHSYDVRIVCRVPLYTLETAYL